MQLLLIDPFPTEKIQRIIVPVLEKQKTTQNHFEKKKIFFRARDAARL